ncbi:MAG: hypothetical protein LUO87_05315, partial [Methanomicrobiales archaeon]|nr:hypothetical protein [Methanomicrobiales archaeon]
GKGDPPRRCASGDRERSGRKLKTPHADAQFPVCVPLVKNGEKPVFLPINVHIATISLTGSWNNDR